MVLTMVIGSLAIIGARVLSSAAMLTVGVMVARTLGPGGRGEYAVVLAVVSLLQLLASLGLTFSNVFHLGQGTLNADAVISASVYVGLGSSLVLMGLVILMMPILRPTIFDDASPSVVLIGLMSLPATVLGGSLNAINLARQRIFLFNGINLVQAMLNLTLVVGFLYGLHLGIRSVMFAWLISSIVFLVAALGSSLLGADRRAALDPRHVRRAAPILLSFGAKGQVGNIAQFMNNRLDQLLVGAWLGSTQLGFYAAAVSVGEAFRFVPDAINTMLFSRISAADSERARIMTARAFKVIVAIAILWSSAMLIGSEIAIRLLYGPVFSPAVTATRLLIPGVGLLMTSSVLGAYLAGRGRVMLNSWVTLVGLVVTSVLDVLLIPHWGINGAAVASLASYSVSAIATFVVYSRTVASQGTGPDLVPARAVVR
jgi:O-antigen/teichoic acid export membrane protein